MNPISYCEHDISDGIWNEAENLVYVYKEFNKVQSSNSHTITLSKSVSKS